MIARKETAPKQEISSGIFFQYLGKGEQMNVFHWNLSDGGIVESHRHSSEQFGYIIKGGFDITIEQETYTIRAGDAYFIPANKTHAFTALGETEAIDVFHPIKTPIPNGSMA